MSSLQKVLQDLTGTKLDEAGAANALAGTKGLETLGALNALAGTHGLGLNAVVQQLTGSKSEAVAAMATYTGGVTPPPVDPPPVEPETPVYDKTSLPLLIGVRL